MQELKNIVAKCIKEALNIDIEHNEILEKLEVPKDKKNGDFAYPCFNLAKVLKNSPINIANSIKEKITLDEKIEKVEVVNGYLNFYIDFKNVSEKILTEIVTKKENFATFEEGKGKR